MPHIFPPALRSAAEFHRKEHMLILLGDMSIFFSTEGGGSFFLTWADDKFF